MRPRDDQSVRSRTPGRCTADPRLEPNGLEGLFTIWVLVVTKPIRANPTSLGELERHALNEHREREDRKDLAEIPLGETHYTSSAHGDCGGDSVRALGHWSATVENDEQVALIQDHAWTVKELLGRQPLGNDVDASRILSAAS